MCSLKVISLAALFFALHIIHASSIKCYQCNYIEPAIPGMAEAADVPTDKTCASGSSIDESLSIRCTKSNSVKVNMPNEEDCLKGKQGFCQDDYICGSYETTLKIFGESHSGVYRGCHVGYTDYHETKECFNVTTKEFIKGGTMFEGMDLTGVDKTGNVTLCYCKTDNCNYD